MESRDRRATEAIGQALELVGLTDRAKHRVATFSGGMKRRLNLAAALLHDPEVLLLDEPTVGVDPQSRNAIFENLETLKARGKTLVYTTHYMEEAERLCDRIVVIDHGKVIANDTLAGLYGRLPTSNKLTIEMPEGVDMAMVTALLAAAGHRFESIAAQAPSLESVFLTLTGRSLRDQ